MVGPKKSATVETSVAKRQPVQTPSKIHRPKSRKIRSVDSLKPPTAVPRAAVFNLDGRIVNKSFSKDKCPVVVQTTEITQSAAITEDRLPKEQVSQDILQRGNSEISSSIHPVFGNFIQHPSSVPNSEISSNIPSSVKVGDNIFNQAIVNYIHEENNKLSSTGREGDKLTKICCRCSSVDICSSYETPKRKFPLEYYLTVCMMVMTALLLVITVLVNYDHLLAICYGQQFHIEIIEVSYVEQWMNVIKRLWTELKKFIVRDKLEL